MSECALASQSESALEFGLVSALVCVSVSVLASASGFPSESV